MNGFRPMPTQLNTERLTLRPPAAGEVGDFHALAYERDPRTAAAPRNGRPTLEDSGNGIARQLEAITRSGIGLLTIRCEGEFLGYCGLTVGRATLDEPEIAYELRARVHGLGYATEAARAVLEAATVTGRARLWASVRTWNHASFRVLDKLGFDRTERRITDDFGDMAWCTRALP